MASLLDLITSQLSGQGGLLGGLGAPQSDEQKQNMAAMWRNAILNPGTPAGQPDPFNMNVPRMNAQDIQSGRPTPQSFDPFGISQGPNPRPDMGYGRPGTSVVPGGQTLPPFLSQTADNALPSMSAPQEVAVPPSGPPPGAMPVNLPINSASASASVPTTAAPAASQPSPFAGINNYIDNNRAMLLGLAGGIAQHGIGGFSSAAEASLAQQKLDLAKLQPVKIGTDSFGADIYAVRDPKAPTGFRRIDLGSQTGTVSNGLTGDEFLKTLPAERQDFIRKVANYEIDPRTLSIKGGHRERTLAEVAQYRPDYQQQNYVAAQEGLKKFQSGQQGNSIRSFNVGIEHLDQLGQLGDAMKNGNLQAVNSIKNQISNWTGNAAVNNFEALRSIVGQEVTKAIVANGGGQAEREEAAKRISSASSPDQLAGVIATYKAAMGAQLQGLKQQYEQSTLRSDFPRLLSEKAKAEIEKHSSAQNSPALPQSAAPSVSEGATATNPKTGEKIIRKNGKWEPVGGSGPMLQL